MTVGSAEATVVVVSALLLGFASGWFMGWFRGYVVRDRERR
jgi:hypothetical protein